MAFPVLWSHKRRAAAAASEVTFLFRDDFTTAQGAPPTSPRDAEPGPGTADISDTEGIAPISGGRFYINTATSTKSNYVTAATYARAAGLCALFKGAILTGYDMEAGFASTQSSGGNRGAIDFQSSSALGFWYLDGSTTLVSGLGDPQDYSNYFVVQRANGSFGIGDDTLLWVDATTNTANTYVTWWQDQTIAAGSIDALRISQLPAPWTTDDGIATDTSASPSAGETFTHEADCLLEWVIDALTTGSAMKIQFRQQDASNFWEVRHTSAGNFQLYENGAQRANANAVLSGGERIVIIADDETITGYYDNTQAWSYGSASAYKTETSGEFEQGGNGSISDLKTWPRTLSGAAKTALDNVVNAAQETPETFELRATFSAADQAYSDAQVLNTLAEGMEDGQFTVTETSGTAEVLSNKARFIKAGGGYSQLGLVSQAITRALGTAFIWWSTPGQTNTFGDVAGWGDVANTASNSQVYSIRYESTATINLFLKNAADATIFDYDFDTYSTGVEEKFALVLGGFDSNGIAYKDGDTKANFAYGVHAYWYNGSAWELVAAHPEQNVSTLYARHVIYQATSYLDVNQSMIPDTDFSSMLSDGLKHLSTFDDTNGTDIEDYTPDKGTGYTNQVGTFEIQGNVAEADSAVSGVTEATITAIADGWFRWVVTLSDTGNPSPGLIVRWTGTNDYWQFQLLKGSNLFRLQEVTGGVKTVRASTSVAFANSTQYIVFVRLSGNVLTGWVDGDNEIAYTSAVRASATGAGLRTYESAAPTQKTQHELLQIKALTDSSYADLDVS